MESDHGRQAATAATTTATTTEDDVNVHISWKKAGTLGEGTFGKVYLGIDEETGEFVAVREMRLAGGDLRESAEFRRMQEGVQLLRRVRHPNLLRCVGMSVRGLDVELFMEYVSGGSIAALLRAMGPLRESVVALYVRQVLAALEYLHGRGVAHRRLRGSNILLSTGGRDAVVKLADYGYSPQSAQLFCHTGALRANWTAPETAADQRCTARSDVWSLGCTVVEMLTAAPPWADQPADAVLRLLCHRCAPAVPATASPGAADFLARCLVPDPAARPTAAALLTHPWLRPREHSAPNAAARAAAGASASVSAAGSLTPRGTQRSSMRGSCPSPRGMPRDRYYSHEEEEDEEEQEEGCAQPRLGAPAQAMMSRSDPTLLRGTGGVGGRPTTVADVVRLSEALRMYTRPAEDYSPARRGAPSFEHSIDLSVATAAVQQHMQERAREQQLAAVQWTAMTFSGHK